MAVRKGAKKDIRSSITIHLSAHQADFVVELLELEASSREGQLEQVSIITDILNSFRYAIEFEERHRSLRGQTGVRGRS